MITAQKGGVPVPHVRSSARPRHERYTPHLRMDMADRRRLAGDPCPPTADCVRLRRGGQWRRDGQGDRVRVR